MKKILVAGIGNIFHGDDAFGCEVVSRLDPTAFPEGVMVVDFGIRAYDLAYALTADHEAIILVDAASRGQRPGALYLIEPEISSLSEDVAVNPHAMDPLAILRMAQSLGGVKGRLFLVGCEPADLGGDEGKMGLSAPVEEAIPEAMAMINSLVTELLEPNGEMRPIPMAARAA